MKKNSIEQFERQIFPIWRGILERDVKADENKNHAEINASGQILFECVTLHKQDLAILNAGIKPHKMAVDQTRMENLRRKALRAGA